MKYTQLLIIASATSALLATPATAVAQERPDLTGYWELSADESDDPRERLASVGLMPTTFGGTGRLSEEDRNRLRRSRALVDSWFKATASYRIIQTGDSVTFVPGGVDSLAYTLPLNGRTIRQKAVIDGFEVEIERKAKWSGPRLQLERKVKDGPKVKEMFALSLDRRGLLVDVRMDAAQLRGGLDFRWVYRKSRRS